MSEQPDGAGRELVLRIGPVAHGGLCVAREGSEAGETGGRVVFVRHALPGERVRAVVTEDHGGSYCRADAVQVLEPARGRVSPPCPVAGPGGCGGCDFQHAEHHIQRQLKAAVVAEQLHRIAGLDVTVPVETLPGGPLRWRTRTRLVADGSGRPGFRAHRSHAVIPVEDCPITVGGALDGVLARRWPPGSEIEVVVDGNGGTHAVALQPGRSPTRVQGSDRAVFHAAGRRWELATTAFWQVHPAAAGALAGIVGEWAAAPAGGLGWDLYGGVGLFGSVLARQVGAAGSVVVVESSPDAVADGAAALADLPQLQFVSGRVQRALPRLSGRPDVVVLDPPRKGAGKQVAAAVAARGPGRIVHVGCDPAALARDIAAFAARGYRLEAIRALDAFPMTHHVECVALLVPVQ